MPFSLASTSAFTAVARKLRLVPEAVLAATLRARIGCAPATSVAVASLVGTETIRFLAVGRRARPRRGYPFRGLWPRHRLATGPRQCGENAGPRPVAVMSRSSIPPGAIATSPTIFSFASAPWQSGRRPEEKFRQAAKSFYGEGHRGRTVRIVDHLPKTRQVIETIASVCQAREPPPLVFSKDCPACDFLSRRGALAVERDDL